MKIKAIEIKNLFGIFDYNILLSNNENLLIITGPNGFGKTMILNVIYNFFNKKFLFFQKLTFDQIKITIDNESSVLIQKIENDNNKFTKFIFLKNETEIDKFEIDNKLEESILKNISMHIPVGRIDENRWIDHRTDRVLELDELITEYAEQLPEKISQKLFKIKQSTLEKYFDILKVHLIREQRLFRKADRHYREEKDQTVMIETIQTYSRELRLLINQNLQQSFKISQELDSTYPVRLVTETKKLTEEEYIDKFDKLKIKQEKLANNGLYVTKQGFLNYSKDDSKALLVYLNDLEKKLGVFDILLEKLELFTNILNDRRFTFKSIQIDRDKGFYFKTKNGTELLLNQLSSGEQHEVVLLYELIFNAKQNVLVLIDEPEISLHITWQKEFLNDVLKIIKIQNIQVILATHSPSIINDRWDLVYNLEKKNEE